MTRRAFNSFIRKQPDDQKTSIDWEAKKNRWLTDLDKLYMTVESWLRHYTEQELISISYFYFIMQEERVGRYRAKEMIILIRGIEVKLTPSGMLFIGSRGRVELAGKKQTIQFVLVNNYSAIERNIPTDLKSHQQQRECIGEIDSFEWCINPDKNTSKYILLTEDSFFTSLLAVAKD